MNIAEYAIKKKTIVLTITCFIIIGGLYAFAKLGRLEDPEFTIKDAKVITQYPGARPTEVEQEVTDILETAIQQLPQLKRITSTSQEGLSIITPTIKDKYDKHSLPQVWDELRRKVNDAQSQLSPGVKPSVVNDDYGDVFGLYFAVTGEGFSYRELKDFVDDLKRELLLVPGVTKINIGGVQQETIYVEISRSRLAQLGIPLDAIYATLSEQNLVEPAGNVQVGDEYISIATTGAYDSVDDISNLLIRGLEGNQLIYMRDIAEVTRGYVTPPENMIRFNGQRALGLGVAVSPDENVTKVGDAVSSRIQQLSTMAPYGLNIHPIYFQSEIVDQAVNGFLVSLVEAIAIVIIVLLIFMGLRSGLLIGFILLLTILGTFLFMAMYNITLQRISLGALVIALGMLVDNAIVITDGILVKIEAGVDKIIAARDVVAQTMWPLLGATLIGILAFAAISLSQDSTGEYTRSLFQVMLISLLLSWIIAVTVAPLLCTMFLKPKAQLQEDPYAGKFYHRYRGLLHLSIRFKWLTAGLMFVLLGLAIFGFSFIEDSFFPDSTTPQFMVDYWRKQGSDIRQTDADIAQIEDFILTLDGVKSVATFIGSGAARYTLTYAPEDNNDSYGQLIVEVDDYRIIESELIPKIQAYLAANLLDAEPNVKKFRFGTGSGFLIQARFSGPDPQVLRQLAEEAMSIMRQDDGLTGIRTDWRQPVKVVYAQYAEAPGRRAGISRSDLNQALNTTFSGTQVGIYREDNKLIPIISRSPEAERNDIDSLSDIQIWSPVTQEVVPIRQVVTDFVSTWENPLLKRRNRKLTITVEADPKQGNASLPLTRIMPQIEHITLPAGYELEWGGEYENSHDAQAGIYQNLPPVAMGMIILLCVPLAIIGVTIGLLVTHQSFGFMAFLGFLSLSGMLIKNAIVLIDQIDLEIAQGKPPFNAIIDSGVSRMRPVAMAAVTTVLGMTPLLFDAFFVSMAVTIMFGLTFATILTLVVVPVFYAILFKVKNSATQASSL